MKKEQATEWLTEIDGICEDFEAKTVFNADEAEHFFVCCQRKICASKGNNAVVVKRLKKD